MFHNAVTALLPTLGPLPSTLEATNYTAYSSALNELANTAPTTSVDPAPLVVTIERAEVLDADAALECARELWGRAPAPLLRLKRALRIRRGRALCFTARASVDPKWLAANFSDLTSTAEAEQELVAQLSCEATAECLSRLILAASIARTGAMQTESAIIRSGRHVKQFDGCRTYAQGEPIQRARQIGWPPMDAVSMTETHAWLARLPGHSQSVGKCRFGRAAASYSYTISPLYDVESACLWPLIGLEALYCDGKEGLMAQILAKSQAYLGARRGHHRTFKAMYAARSKFVHGQLNLPMAFTLNDSTPEADAFRVELDEAKHLATAVLLATLRRAIGEKRTSLEFEYALARASGSPEGTQR